MSAPFKSIDWGARPAVDYCDHVRCMSEQNGLVRLRRAMASPYIHIHSQYQATSLQRRPQEVIHVTGTPWQLSSVRRPGDQKPNPFTQLYRRLSQTLDNLVCHVKFTEQFVHSLTPLTILTLSPLLTARDLRLSPNTLYIIAANQTICYLSPMLLNNIPAKRIKFCTIDALPSQLRVHFRTNTADSKLNQL